MIRWLQMHSGPVGILLGVLSLITGCFTGGLTLTFIDHHYYFSSGRSPDVEVGPTRRVEITRTDFFPRRPAPALRIDRADIERVPTANPVPPPGGESLGPWTSREFPCADLTCRLFVLSQNYYWAYESKALVLYQGEKGEIQDHLQAPGLQTQIADATDVIAVGTASCEGSRSREANRAALRAERLEDWLHEAMPDATTLASRPQLWRLNLGKYRTPEPCEPLPDNPTWEQDKTHWQRRVVFLLLDRTGTHYSDSELEVLLRKAMNREAALDIHPRDYWEFDLRRRFH